MLYACRLQGARLLCDAIAPVTAAVDIHFGQFRINRTEQRLYRGAEIIDLRPKAWELLLFLSTRPHYLLAFDEIYAVLWPDVVVAPHALTKLVSELRAALGDESRDHIQNVPRRGYRFTPNIGSAAARAREGDGNADGEASCSVFVAREEELAALRECWQRAWRGKRQFAFVSGEPGIGKTTLIGEFIKAARADRASAAEPFLVARGQCLPLQTEPAPYAPMLEALHRIASERDVTSLLRRYAPAWLVQLPGLLSVDETTELQTRLAGSGSQRMLNEAAVLLEAITAHVPLLVVLEDAHWADAATIDLLRTVMQRGEAARLLVIVTYRPAEIALGRHPLHGVIQSVPRIQGGMRLALGALPMNSLARFLERRFAAAPEADLVAGLEQATGGNPLFLGLMIEHLIERGWLEARGGRWRHSVPPTVANLGMPPSLREMIEVEVVSAAPAHLELLEAAALAGERFTAAIVAAATGHSTEKIDQVFFDLVRARHVVRLAGDSGSPEYELVHDLYRQILSERISPTRARSLHQRIGEYLEGSADADRIGRAPLLAHHFRAAGDCWRCAKYLELAAANAAQRFAYRETYEALGRAIEAIRQLPESPERAAREAARLLEFANLRLAAVGNNDEQARPAYQRALELAEKAAQPSLAFRAKLGLCFQSAMSSHDDAISLAQDLVATADQGHPELAAAAHSYAVLVYYMRGELRTALDHSDAACRMLEAAAPGIPAAFDLRTRIHNFRSGVLSALGRREEACAEHHLALDRATALRKPIEIVETLSWRICECIVEDEADEALRLADTMIELATKHGLQKDVELGGAWRAWARARLGTGSLEEIEAAAQMPLLRSSTWAMELLRLCLAEEYRRRGDFTAARRELEATRSLSWRYLEAARWRVLGELLIDERSASCAGSPSVSDVSYDGLSCEECLQRAVAVARRHGSVPLEQRAQQALGMAAKRRTPKATKRTWSRRS